MITANELRIGNYIAAKGGKSFQVQLYHINKIQNEKCNFYGTPITEEWLFKFGFEKDVLNTPGEALDSVFLYTKDSFFVFYCHENKMIMVDYVSNKVTGRLTTTIRYVHQLQNLYFALTNKELEIQ